MIKKAFFLLGLCMTPLLNAQLTQTIRGRVIDKESKTPLIGANDEFQGGVFTMCQLIGTSGIGILAHRIIGTLAY